MVMMEEFTKLRCERLRYLRTLGGNRHSRMDVLAENVEHQRKNDLFLTFYVFFVYPLCCGCLLV